jgi:Flp pilus assembly CpaE family ATPase
MAEDGWEALRKIKDEHPDLVVLDMMMPRLDGIGVIKRVREDPEIATIPILMLTARDRTIDMVHGLESGADDYLGKPFEWVELLARVQSLLRRSRHEWTDAEAHRKRAGVVVFLGAKGGTGATTIAANVGIAIAKAGKRTVLAEFAPFRGTAATVLGVAARRQVDRLPLTRPDMLTPAMIEDTLLDHPSGLRLLVGPTGERELPSVESANALLEGLRLLCDVVLVDLGGLTDSFAQAALQRAHQVWVVTQPELASLDRAGATIHALERWGVRPKKIGLIANQTNPVMRAGAPEIAQATGREILSAIPAAPQACYEATKRGEALLDLAPDLPTSRAIAALAQTIGAKPDWFPTAVPRTTGEPVAVATGDD